MRFATIALLFICIACNGNSTSSESNAEANTISAALSVEEKEFANDLIRAESLNQKKFMQKLLKLKTLDESTFKRLDRYVEIRCSESHQTCYFNSKEN